MTDIQRAAKALVEEGVWCGERLHPVPCPECLALAMRYAQAAATVLIPEGNVAIGGTCKDCRFCGKGTFCDNEDSPTYDDAITPDFGCVHFLPPQETNG